MKEKECRSMSDGYNKREANRDKQRRIGTFCMGLT